MTQTIEQIAISNPLSPLGVVIGSNFVEAYDLERDAPCVAKNGLETLLDDIATIPVGNDNRDSGIPTSTSGISAAGSGSRK